MSFLGWLEVYIVFFDEESAQNEDAKIATHPLDFVNWPHH